MRVLGRDLVAPFDLFWNRFESEIDVPLEYIEQGHSIVFEDQGADLTAPNLPEWASIPDDDLAYHVAHQLTHIVMRNQGYPATSHGKQYPDDSAEERIGGDLEEMVLHPSLEEILKPFGFRKPFITQRMVNGALKAIPKAPVPEPGIPWFFTWAMRYCELRTDLGEEEWDRLRTVYESHSPKVCELGEEFYDIMREIGWGSREQALDALIRTRDTLGLGVDARVLVFDPVSGRVF